MIGLRNMMYSSLKSLTGLDFGSKTNVIFGDSLSLGYGLSNSADRFFSLLNSERNGTEVNFGVTGEALTSFASTYGCGRTVFNEANVPTKTSAHKYLFIAYSGNDVLINRAEMTAAAFKSQLSAKIDWIIANKSWTAADIVIVNGYWLNDLNENVGDCGVTAGRTRTESEAFYTAANEVAQEKGTILADTYTLTKNSSAYQASLYDNLHPTSVGHRILADYFISMSYVPQTSSDTSLLTGATRLSPPPGYTDLGGNKYQKPSGAEDGETAFVLTGDGFVAQRYKADSGIGFYMLNGIPITDYAGYTIEASQILIEGNAGNSSIALPAVNDFIILKRTGGVMQLLTGSSLETATVKWTYGTFPYGGLGLVSPSSTNIYLYDFQGLNIA